MPSFQFPKNITVHRIRRDGGLHRHSAQWYRWPRGRSSSLTPTGGSLRRRMRRAARRDPGRRLSARPHRKTPPPETRMSRGTRTTATAYRTAGWPAMVFRRSLLGSQGVPAAGRERSLDPARLAANRNFQLLQLDERCLASADAQARDIMAMPPRQRSRFRAGWGTDFGRGERNSELGYSETNSAAHPDTIRGGGQEGDFEYHVALVDNPTGHPPPPRRPQGSRSSCQDSSCTCSYKNESSLL